MGCLGTRLAATDCFGTTPKFACTGILISLSGEEEGTGQAKSRDVYEQLGWPGRGSCCGDGGGGAGYCGCE